MKTRIFSSVVAFSVLFCGAAQASETIEVGLGATTLGTTVEGRYVVSDNFALRGIYALGLSESFNETENGVAYDITGNIGGFALLADYKPFGGGFVLGAGLFSSNTSIDLSATVSNQDFGDSTNVSGSLTGEAKFKNATSPMVLFGYQGSIGSLNIRGDLGAMFTGGIDLSASASSGSISQADIDKELAEVEKDASAINYFPFVGFTITYEF